MERTHLLHHYCGGLGTFSSLPARLFLSSCRPRTAIGSCTSTGPLTACGARSAESFLRRTSAMARPPNKWPRSTVTCPMARYEGR
eukprot:5277380-Heterocapsa_arctica.AAC.1